MALSGLIEIILLLLVVKIQQEVQCSGQNRTILEIIQDVNKEHQIQLNLLINLNGSRSEEFNGLYAEVEQPKIAITKPSMDMSNLFKHFNMQVLTIARVDARNFNTTLATMEHLLWKRHFTTIIVMFESEGDEMPNLSNLFERCWTQGYTSVLVWWRNATFTYSPYPKIQIQRVDNFLDYRGNSDLHNYQQLEILVPMIEFPPRCFSYRNRQGRLIRTGFYYKLIENFVLHYNGTLRHKFVDIWQLSLDSESVNDIMFSEGFQFITTHLMESDSYLNSESFDVGNCFLIIPSGREIQQSLYLMISFSPTIWLMVILIMVMMSMVIYGAYSRQRSLDKIFESLLHALQVIIFISSPEVKYKTLFNFMLHLLFLFTGIFITNIYICNLSSMYASRIYEPDLLTLEDVARTELGIHVYTLDYERYMTLENLPSIIYQRMFAGSNKEYYVNRQNLNLVNISVAVDDVGKFLFFQQLYLKRPIAKFIPEPMFMALLSVVMPHCSPFIEHFNRYLTYVKDSGLLHKFMMDSKWDGVMSGELKFMLDNPMSRSLSLSYFQYAFIIWLAGLSCALLGFLCEIVWSRRNKKLIII